MKKVMMMTVAMIGAVAFADSYLYWMVDQSESEGDAIAFSFAQIKTDGGEDVGDNILGASSAPAITAGPINTALGGIDYSGSYFLIELLDGSGNVVDVSDSFAFAALSQYVYDGKALSGATPWRVSSFTVPEPNSAALLLLGLAGLAMRRRKERNANA